MLSSSAANRGSRDTTCNNDYDGLVSELSSMIDIVQNLEHKNRLVQRKQTFPVDATAEPIVTCSTDEVDATGTKMMTSSIIEESNKDETTTEPLQNPIQLLHYSTIPQNVYQVYELLSHGATIIHGTSTKFTLLKSNRTEQIKIGTTELIQGCYCLVTVCIAVSVNVNTKTQKYHANELETVQKNNTLVDTTSASSNSCNRNLGCCRSLRKYVFRSVLSILSSVLRLVKAFQIQQQQQLQQQHQQLLHPALNNSAAKTDECCTVDPNYGSPETGAVWEACDTVMTTTTTSNTNHSTNGTTTDKNHSTSSLHKIPVGNRNCMRRDLLTYRIESDETINEFQEIVNISLNLVDYNEITTSTTSTATSATPSLEEMMTKMIMATPTTIDNDDNMIHNMLYNTNCEINLINACIGIMKCSKNCILLTMMVCDAIGTEYVVPYTNNNNNNNNNNDSTNGQKKVMENSDDNDAKESTTKVAALAFISHVHDLASIIGLGVTDLGSCLYPPLLSSLSAEMEHQVYDDDNDDEAVIQEIQIQMEYQIQSIEQLEQYLIESTTTTSKTAAIETTNNNEKDAINDSNTGTTKQSNENISRGAVATTTSSSSRDVVLLSLPVEIETQVTKLNDAIRIRKLNAIQSLNEIKEVICQKKKSLL